MSPHLVDFLNPRSKASALAPPRRCQHVGHNAKTLFNESRSIRVGQHTATLAHEDLATPISSHQLRIRSRRGRHRPLGAAQSHNLFTPAKAIIGEQIESVHSRKPSQPHYSHHLKLTGRDERTARRCTRNWSRPLMISLGTKPNTCASLMARVIRRFAPAAISKPSPTKAVTPTTPSTVMLDH